MEGQRSPLLMAYLGRERQMRLAGLTCLVLLLLKDRRHLKLGEMRCLLRLTFLVGLQVDAQTLRLGFLGLRLRLLEGLLTRLLEQPVPFLTVQPA